MTEKGCTGLNKVPLNSRSLGTSNKLVGKEGICRCNYDEVTSG